MKTYVMFWIKSSRGTDDRRVFGYPAKPTKDRLETDLERWCKAHACWDHGENSISYGYRMVKMPPRRELIKRYNLAAERKRKADERWKSLAAMLNPMC